MGGGGAGRERAGGEEAGGREPGNKKRGGTLQEPRKERMGSDRTLLYILLGEKGRRIKNLRTLCTTIFPPN